MTTTLKSLEKDITYLQKQNEYISHVFDEAELFKKNKINKLQKEISNNDHSGTLSLFISIILY